MKKTRGYKKVPSFWGDFEDGNLVIVESDDPKHPLISMWRHPKGDATIQIEEEEKLISKLEMGQIDYRVLARSFDDEFVKSIYPNFKQQ